MMTEAHHLSSILIIDKGPQILEEELKNDLKKMKKAKPQDPTIYHPKC